MKKSWFPVVALVLAVLAVANGVHGQCSRAAAKEGAGRCGLKAGGACPIAAVVAKLDLTEEQEKQVEAARKECETVNAKAATLACAKTCAKTKTAACNTYIKKVKAALNAEQVKAFEALLAAGQKEGKGGCTGAK